MKKELPKQYDPKQVENQIYEMWMENDCFKAEVDPDKKPYSIVMPPPNVTGQLHMGHALDSTLQDILTRYKRMQGYSALWLPGTDHAGIATQIKVEEELLDNYLVQCDHCYHFLSGESRCRGAVGIAGTYVTHHL